MAYSLFWVIFYYPGLNALLKVLAGIVKPLGSIDEYLRVTLNQAPRWLYNQNVALSFTHSACVPVSASISVAVSVLVLLLLSLSACNIAAWLHSVHVHEMHVIQLQLRPESAQAVTTASKKRKKKIHMNIHVSLPCKYPTLTAWVYIIF